MKMIPRLHECRDSSTPPASSASMNELSEHAVIVHFAYGSTDLGVLFALEDTLEQSLSAAGAGEFDGHDLAVNGSDGYLYMYGPDADRLFDAVKSVLESCPFTNGATVTRRYGPAGDDVRESIVTIAHSRPE